MQKIVTNNQNGQDTWGTTKLLSVECNELCDFLMDKLLCSYIFRLIKYGVLVRWLSFLSKLAINGTSNATKDVWFQLQYGRGLQERGTWYQHIGDAIVGLMCAWGYNVDIEMLTNHRISIQQLTIDVVSDYSSWLVVPPQLVDGCGPYDR